LLKDRIFRWKKVCPFRFCSC